MGGKKIKSNIFPLGRTLQRNPLRLLQSAGIRIYRRLTLSFCEIDKLRSLSKQTCAACAEVSLLKLIAQEFKPTTPWI